MDVEIKKYTSKQSIAPYVFLIGCLSIALNNFQGVVILWGMAFLINVLNS